MKRFDYHKPRSLEEAWKLKEEIPESRFIAGGTDLMVEIRNGEISPSALISLRSIPDLDAIETDPFRIGALATISDIINHKILQTEFPILVEAAKTLGSVQVRNVATVGGNLCNGSPSSDLAPALLVLEAKLHLQSIQGSRTIPLNDFFLGPGQTCLGPGEILTDIVLKPPGRGTYTLYLKKGRMKMDLAIASLAVLVKMKGKTCLKARVAAGSVAPVPVRLTKVEDFLEGATLTENTEELISQAQELAVGSVNPIADIRSSVEYRRQIIKIYLKRALQQILQWSKA